MSSILSNAATSKLVSAITSSTTTLSITAGSGSKFPVTSPTEDFNVVLQDSSNNLEICKVTSRTGDSLTVLRGQESTVARSFGVGDIVAVRMTAKAFNDKPDLTTVQGLISTAIVALSGTLTATFTAALALKADLTALTAGLALKIDTAVAEAALALKASLTGANFTGAINTHFATIEATAETTPLWVAASGNVQIWTGTPTITAFPEATQAGASRLVYPAAGTTLTNNATISVQGGALLTVAEAGDTWKITAKTLTTVDVLAFRKSGLSLVNFPSENPKVKEFSDSTNSPATYQQFAILLDNNRIKTWGRADNLALGIAENGNATYLPSNPIYNVPVPSEVFVKNFIVTSGAMYVLLTNGWVYSCGVGTYGNLGHGDVLNREILTRIEFFITNNIVVDKIFAEGSRVTFSAGCAFFVNAAGNVWACGYNNQGQLGVGNTAQQNTPTPIAGAFTGVVKIINSGYHEGHTVLLRTDKTAYATGRNANGQLGVGDLVNRSAFTLMTGTGGTDVAQIEVTGGATDGTGAGFSGSTIVRRTNGTVFTCGYNGYGQLGLNDTATRTALVQIPSLTNIESVGISGGHYGYAYAVSTTKRLFTWGYNAQGVVGNGTLIAQLTPFNVNTWSGNTLGDPPFVGKIAQVETHLAVLGSSFIIVLDTDGNLWFSGADSGSFCGDTAINRPRFAPFLGSSLDAAGEKITKIRAHGFDASYRIFAISDAGKLYGIGENSYGVARGLSVQSQPANVQSLQLVRGF